MVVETYVREEDLQDESTPQSEEVDTVVGEQDDKRSISVNTDSDGQDNFHSEREPLGLLLGCGDAKAVCSLNPSWKTNGGPQETNKRGIL